MLLSKIAVAFGALLAACTGAQASTVIANDTSVGPPIAANDTSVFKYFGRWARSGTSDMKSDWPCTAVRFDVNALSSGCSIELAWGAIRSRVLLKVTDKSTGVLLSNETLYGSSFGSASNPPLLHHEFNLPNAGTFVVEFKKLTEGAPFALGIGRLLSPSVLTFRGISSWTPSCAVDKRGYTASNKRAIDFYGASDTAGYCVDGNPKMNVLQCKSLGLR